MLTLAAVVLLCIATPPALSRLAEWVLERRYPAEGRFVHVAGARLHYVERLPSGPPRACVLLIHGASGSQSDLTIPLASRLTAKGFRALAIDRPGLGWSERPHGRADAAPAAQADLLRAAAAELGVDRAIVVGHSLGGAVAAELALRHPDFVSALALLAPVTHPWPGGVAWHYSAAAAAPLAGMWFARLVALPVGLLVLPRALRSVFGPLDTPPDYARATGAALVLTPKRFHDNAQDVLALQESVAGLAPRLPRLRMPTAILAGDSDGVVSIDFHALAAAREIPGAELSLMEGTGHSPHWARPDEVVAAVERLDDRSRAGQSAAVDAEADLETVAATLKMPVEAAISQIP